MKEDVESNWEGWQKTIHESGWQFAPGNVWEMDTRHGYYQVHRDSYDDRFVVAWYSDDREEEDVESYESFNELLQDIDPKR
jgi:hypothetical protein